MKKKHLLTKILSVFSLALFLTGCTQLNYVDEDFQTVKTYHIQTSEAFSIQGIEKSMDKGISVKAGISETVLDQVLVLYMDINNTSDVTFKFDVRNLSVTSPIGDVSIVPAANYIEAYQGFEASNYANLASASTAINSFASLQNQYRQTDINSTSTIDNTSTKNPELQQLENTIRGIQRHSITSYKFIEPNSKEYFYIFLRKPEEYPIVIQYGSLTYKFGGKRNAKN